MGAAARFAVHTAVSANENYIQVDKSPAQTHNHTAPSAIPSHPLSSAKLHRDHFMMSRITGKPPIMNHKETAPHQPIAPACLCLPINIPPES